MLSKAMLSGERAVESGRGGYFSRPSHTTGHAAPHPAVHKRGARPV
jgi:hypothetical protein